MFMCVVDPLTLLLSCLFGMSLLLVLLNCTKKKAKTETEREGTNAGAQQEGKGFKDPHDPNYQTLAGVDDNKAFGATKEGGVQQQQPEFKDAHDPQYQTLAGVDDKVFEKK